MAVKQSHGHCKGGVQHYGRGCVYVFVSLGEPLEILKVREFH